MASCLWHPVSAAEHLSIASEACDCDWGYDCGKNKFEEDFSTRICKVETSFSDWEFRAEPGFMAGLRIAVRGEAKSRIVVVAVACRSG